ncbi:amidohydrolase family protein [Vibrio gazogenes]|uniref:N-acyl-D-amino-acid deacylase n=1 Tax=Vibrio gazogenes DSM 21264 = NBRC 103151 TaxID=1123492 RepID=A0A1M4V1P2_VIBGA|nr:D-aminoacylase [Vibrio gazogenes]USP15636.1 D-aminoacylase [Vibrio gazogenes]SHE62820.1 N-acyl-D-amino-acid deacylase [Vibrio gazogenes DSM 21264] [Vibrio gazogenes DSM 21264 = NBRC 103151]SJN54673.1 D-aminoacylase [Vibrio gazogenes]
MDFEVLLRNFNIVDGSGGDITIQDVGIVGDKIVKIGDLSSCHADVKIEGNGLYLAPGFIDVHTHDDINVIQQPEMLPKISQGVTTVIVGNCGISASPVTLTSEPPDPMNLLGERDKFSYATFSQYAQAVEAAQPAINVGALVGHTSLRQNHMDNLYRPATNSEIQAMRSQLRDSLEHGALGLSTGLAYASAREAPTEEVLELSEELSHYDGIYVTHLRTEFEGILDAMEEAFDIGCHGNVPVVISHHKCAGKANWGRTEQTLRFMDERSKTQDIGCDCYPYSAGSSTLDLGQVTSDFDITITWSEPEPEQGGRNLADIADIWGVSLIDAAKRLQPAGAIYHNMLEEDVARVLKYPKTMIGSDGLPNDPLPHPRLWGTFPRVIGHYCRDEKLFSLSEAVRKMTSLSAQRFGLKNRGLIKEQYYADLVIFDFEKIIDMASFNNPKQVSAGIEYVLVNGNIVYQEKSVNKKRSGKFLYRNK